MLLLLELAVNAVVDGIENILNSDAGLVGGLGSLLVHTSLDEDAVPVVLGCLVDGVGATDVALGSVADKVDSLGRSNKTVLVVSPLTHQSRSKLKCGNLGLAKGVSVENTLALGQVVEGNLEHATESTHAETNVLVGSRPDNIVVREVEGRTLIVGLAAGAKAATLGHGNIEHDLNVTSPVARVGKDEDSVNDNVVEVAVTGVGVLLNGELTERSCGRVVLDDVARGDNVLEAITLGNLAALLALATNNKDSAVGLGHLAHGSVTADELTGLDIALELAREVTTALLLGLATTICEEDVRTVKREKMLVLRTTP